MTLTVKDFPESASLGKVASPSQNSEKKRTPSARSNPISLEVQVTVRSLPGETANATGPIREQTKTVIVFDNGAVLRLWNSLDPGQKIILSNAEGDDVVCRVVSGRNLLTVQGYIEVEFLEPFENFWNRDPAKTARVASLVNRSLERPQPPAPAPPLDVVPQMTPVRAPAPPAEPAPIPPISPDVMIPNLSNIPSFDLASAVRIPPPSAEPLPNEPAAPSSRRKKELTPGRNEAATPALIEPVPIAETIPPGRTAPAQPFPPPRAQKAGGERVVARGMLDATADFSSDETQSRSPLLLAAAVLVLAAMGAAYFFLHHGKTATPAASALPAAPVAATEPSSSADLPAAQPSEAQPTAAPEASLDSAQAEGNDIYVTPSAAPAAEAASSNAASPRKASDTTGEAEEVDSTKQRQRLANFKMGRPAAPVRNAANGNASDVTDVNAPVAGGVGLPAANLSAALHFNEPAPPPSVLPSRVVTEPKLLSSTPAIYPPAVKRLNIQGAVVVVAAVDAKGNVTLARATSGPDALRPAAVDAVKRWKYSPALIDGQPANSQVTISVQFHLN